MNAGSAAPPSSSTVRAAGKVKGTLLIARMKYVRAQGRENEDRVLRRLSTADQAVLRGMLLPSTWYPADLLLRLESTAAAILALSDRKRLFLDMGRFTATTNLGPAGIQRPYVRVGDPHYLLRHVPRMYTSQHTAGSRTYEQAGERAAIMRAFDADEADPEDCLTTVGWMQRAIEICGGRGVAVTETCCRALGSDHCEFHCKWE